jgi:hypothetical protein
MPRRCAASRTGANDHRPISGALSAAMHGRDLLYSAWSLGLGHRGARSLQRSAVRQRLGRLRRARSRRPAR